MPPKAPFPFSGPAMASNAMFNKQAGLQAKPTTVVMDTKFYNSAGQLVNLTGAYVVQEVGAVIIISAA